MNAATKKPRKKIEKRVCWKPRERNLLLAYIASRLVELYSTVPKLDKLHKVIFDLAMEAQSAKLSVDRQRKLTGFTSFHWGEGFEEAYEMALQKALAAREEAKAPSVPPEAEKPVVSPAGGLLDSLADELLATKKWRSLEEQLSDTLFRKLKARVEEKAFGKLEVEMGLKPSAPANVVVVQERPTGDEKPRFVIAGLISKEFNRLEKKFGDRCELVHVSVDANLKNSFEVCKRGFTLVANNSPHQFVAKAKAATDNYEIVNGGVSSFERILEHKLAG